MELKDLEKMKVDELRAEASKLEGVEGVHSMKKQELIDLLAEKLDIQRPEAQSEDDSGEAKDVEGAKAEGESATPTKDAEDAKETKTQPKVAQKKGAVFKERLKALQAKRKQALADRDYETLADVRMRIKKYKRKLKKESTATASSSS